MSSEISGREADVRAITDDAAAQSSGVPHASELLAFVEAVMADEAGALDVTRKALIDVVGPVAFTDAAGVIGNFQRMVRIADGTGIPLDAPVMAFTEGLRNELGIDDFASASHTKPMGAAGRLVARLMAPISKPLIRLVGRVYRS